MINPNLEIRARQFRPLKLGLGLVMLACLVPPAMQLRGAYRHSVAKANAQAAADLTLTGLDAENKIVNRRDEIARDRINNVDARLPGYNCRTQPLPSDAYLYETLAIVRPTEGTRVIRDNASIQIGTIDSTGNISIDLSNCGVSANNQ